MLFNAHHTHTHTGLHIYDRMIFLYHFFTSLHVFLWLNPHNHSGVVTLVSERFVQHYQRSLFFFYTHSLTIKLVFRWFEWSIRTWREKGTVCKKVQPNICSCGLYVVFNNIFIIIVISSSPWVCVHFNLYFILNVSRATNFIYIAHLGIVIEQKIVLTFRITFTMWNSFTQSIGMKALRREPKHTKKNRLSMDRFFHIHVFGYAWRWFKMICYFWCGVPYYSIQSVCSVAVDCWLDDLIIFT